MALLRSDVINRELLEQVLKKVEVNKRFFEPRVEQVRLSAPFKPHSIFFNF